MSYDYNFERLLKERADETHSMLERCNYNVEEFLKERADVNTDLRPYSYLDEYIDFLDASAETKGEIRENLINSIEKSIEDIKETEREAGKKESEDKYKEILHEERERWKLAYKRELAEKEDYIRMYFMLYTAITSSKKDASDVIEVVIEYLDSEFAKVFKYYTEELPVGLELDDPKDIKLLREIEARINTRQGILGGLLP